MKNISRRDVKMFLFGISTMLLITLILDWDSAVQGFNDGPSTQLLLSNQVPLYTVKQPMQKVKQSLRVGSAKNLKS